VPTVYIRKDHYDAIVSMKQDPTAYINDLLNTTFQKTVSYALKDEHVESVTTKKKVKKDV